VGVVELSQRLMLRVDGYRREMVEFQKAITAIPAVGPENGGDGEWERFLFLRDWLEKVGLGVAEEHHASDDRVVAGLRPNLVVRIPGKDAAPRTWVLVHTDTVPAGQRTLWDSDPYSVVEREDRLVGRGVEDNQQGLTAALFALRALRAEGVVPAGEAGAILVADEETGNGWGIDHVLETASDLVDPADLVVVPDFGDPGGKIVEVAEKAVLTCRFIVRGKQVHASTPDQGVNAHRAAAHLVVRLDHRLAEAFPYHDPVFEPSRSTFEPTRRDANVLNTNTIPGEERFYVDCRVLPHYLLEEVKSVLEETAEDVEEDFSAPVSVDYPLEVPAAPSTPADAPVVRAVMGAVEMVMGLRPRPVGIGGGTVAAAFRKRGIPAAVWSTLDGTAHQANEYCRIDNMVNDAKVFACLYAGLAR